MKVFDIDKTELKDANGRPLNVFHTTPMGRIKSYFPLSHFGTAKAANMRAVFHIQECAQIEVEDRDDVSEYISPRIIKMLGERVPPMSGQRLNLYMKNPLEIPDLRDHSLAGYFHFFKGLYKPQARFLSQEEWIEQGVKGCSKTEYKELLTEFIFVEPFLSPRRDLIRELNSEKLFDPMPYVSADDELPDWLRQNYPTKDGREKIFPVELATRVAFQRMIRFLEGEGYDGFKYKNVFEDTGSASYIVFRPEQVFNTLNPADRVHRVESISASQKEFLLKKEHDFFSERGMPSPSERVAQYKKAGYLQNRMIELGQR